MRSRLADGRVIGTDGSEWLYMAVPMAPFIDAVDKDAVSRAAAPLALANGAMARLAQVRVPRRALARSYYREIHILVVNIPDNYTPPRASPLSPYLSEAFEGRIVERRLCLYGVRLEAHVGMSSPRQAIETVTNTLLYGGAPTELYERDFVDVHKALVASGMADATKEDIKLANSWWGYGWGPGTPMLVHPDHLHVFDSPGPAGAAARLKAKFPDCNDWPAIVGASTLTFGCVADWDLPPVDELDPAAMWVPELLRLGAVCVSIRGRVEPARVTRNELRSNRKKFLHDLEERASQGKMERAEQEELTRDLGELEALYASSDAPATLVDCSTVVAFSGKSERGGYDVSDTGLGAGLVLSTLVNRQRAGMAECWLASPVRANPYLHDLPGHVVAASGANNLSVVGDRSGALLGFTERDRQPAYVSPVAASTGDALPMLAVLGATGSGKLLKLSTPIPTPHGWTTMGELTVGDSVFGRDGKPCTVTYVSPIESHPDLYRVSFSDGQEIYADKDHQWVVSSSYTRNRVRRPKRRAALARWADAHCMAALLEGIAASCQSEEITLDELVSKLPTDGLRKMWHNKDQLLHALDFVGCPYRYEERAMPLHRSGRIVRNVRVYDVSQAYKALAVRLRQQYAIKPLDGAPERVMTTGEMLAEGLHLNGGNARFSVRLSAPVELPDVDLPVAPYVLGVWLGDGSSWGGQITQGATESCTDPTTGQTDREFMVEQLRAAGYEAKALGPQMIGTRGLTLQLRNAGVLRNKHVPPLYLRASANQRLALLQGLMDTDGTVNKQGCCEVAFNSEKLASGVLELIRSLGLKASISGPLSKITEPDPQRPGHKRRRVTGTRWRIKFTTTTAVFRLPRKARRLPTQVRETQKWLYVTDITPVAPEPARCVQVSSLDGTYLAEGFIPTHNSVAALHLAYQFSQIRTHQGQRTPVVFLDPKSESSHDPTVLAAGGQVYSLDNLLTADGVFDPLRFTKDRSVAVDIASSMLLHVNPWGSRAQDYETPLASALAYGISQGATCTGQALRIAAEHGAPPEMVKAVFDLAEASSTFRACVGIDPKGQALSVAEGMTLIKVGRSYLNLPEAGTPVETMSQQHRVAVELVRMMVFGSAMALTGREGVLILDEAWVMLTAGRTEVDRLGRLARSQQVLPVLLTQKTTDALSAGLAGYISRGIILPIADRDEARAALQLFRLEPTEERLARITAPATIGAVGADVDATPNWGSYRALRDPRTGAVLRGAIGLYVDLSGRAVPVEVDLPRSFLEMASTNPDDIRRREAAMHAKTA
jgi:hypothetical protein